MYKRAKKERNRELRKQENNKKTITKYLLIITLNVNGLNTPKPVHRLPTTDTL